MVSRLQRGGAAFDELGDADAATLVAVLSESDDRPCDGRNGGATGDDAATLAEGVRRAVPVSVASVFFGISFGVSAIGAGLSPVQATVMSVICCAGAAQLIAVGIVGAGGGVPAAILGALLMNSRFVPMSLSVAPSLSGSRVRRAVESQGLTDAGWAMANLGGGRFARRLMWGASLGQYVTLVFGTAAGAYAGSAMSDPDAFGIDAVVPAFFVGLLAAELKRPEWRLRAAVAGVAGAIAFALTPFVPAGLPVLAASAAAIVGFWSPEP